MNKIFLILLLACISFISLYSNDNKNKTDKSSTSKGKKVNSISLQGQIAMVGNEPFTRLIIRASNNESYEIMGDKKKELQSLQGKTVSIVGNSIVPYRGMKRIEVKSYTVKD